MIQTLKETLDVARLCFAAVVVGDCLLFVAVCLLAFLAVRRRAACPQPAQQRVPRPIPAPPKPILPQQSPKPTRAELRRRNARPRRKRRKRKRFLIDGRRV